MELSDINEKVLAKYNFVKKLGAGAQGAVYLVTRKLDEKKAALKIIIVKPQKDEDLETALNKALLEIKILKEVSAEPKCNMYISCYHSHMVDVKTGTIYLEMEYIEGPDLKEYVKPLYESGDADTLISIIYMVVKAITIALTHIHQYGVLHNDIKPENIVVERKTKIPKLVDFGIACEAKPKNDTFCTTPLNKEIGECCLGGGGTYNYLAPERTIYGVRYPQSDIWSLGATMYTIITGTLIWGGRDPKNTNIKMIKAAIQTEEPEELGSEIDLLNTLIDGMTRKDITKRLTSDKILHLLRNK